MESSVKRLFLGIRPDAVHFELLQRFVETNENIGLSWVKPENWHVTCLFVGDVDVNEIPEFKTKISEVVKSFQPFQLTAERFTFMPASRPRMLWLRFHKHKDFSRLNLMLAKVLLAKDLERQPIPHITLSRFKHPPKVHMLSVNLPETSLPIGELVLFESKLHPTGAEYITLKVWKL
ncbi:MAG: RNA 2',3'-cyclic phosphodiesterase [Bacteroidales bacterium]|jgi:2'-5' RNA ligase|nr:RNA 2',3'-cyclic phosphodiesterase [Bacteroidales bacterium]